MAGFSDRMKVRREELGMSQSALAIAARLTPAAISQFESGIRMPNHSSLKKLSKALNVTTDYLLGKKEFDIDALFSDPRARDIADGWNDLSLDQQQILFYQYQFLAQKQGIPPLV